MSVGSEAKDLAEKMRVFCDNLDDKKDLVDSIKKNIEIVSGLKPDSLTLDVNIGWNADVCEYQSRADLHGSHLDMSVIKGALISGMKDKVYQLEKEIENDTEKMKEFIGS